jgi:hypothetical protein
MRIFCSVHCMCISIKASASTSPLQVLALPVLNSHRELKISAWMFHPMSQKPAHAFARSILLKDLKLRLFEKLTVGRCNMFGLDTRSLERGSLPATDDVYMHKSTLSGLRASRFSCSISFSKSGANHPWNRRFAKSNSRPLRTQSSKLVASICATALWESTPFCVGVVRLVMDRHFQNTLSFDDE